MGSRGYTIDDRALDYTNTMVDGDGYPATGILDTGSEVIVASSGILCAADPVRNRRRIIDISELGSYGHLVDDHCGKGPAISDTGSPGIKRSPVKNHRIGIGNIRWCEVGI